eukprot:CAMPEP_0181317636 /NCGR_PEP_ID=MMETSP1101-20121128/16578_1 /TAXON_ID=46948 /ORGANISM="Rhodomonas abbreviata, Strain Caron Lab Isolate" /LENGTH=453 /DNA_ID=CAMNT_0023425051 /DNA_START=383 /DNA_END=1744 /DNA_ORIENTATION=+
MNRPPFVSEFIEKTSVPSFRGSCPEGLGRTPAPDAPDMEGQTIRHWNEDTGSIGWALVAPNLGKMFQKEKNLKEECERLRRMIDDSSIDVPSFEERMALRKQLVAQNLRLEVLSRTIQHYRPDEHFPECIGEGGEGLILCGKCLETGKKVAIKVEKVVEGKPSSLQREFNVLRALQDDKSFPNIKHYGRQILNTNPSATDCRVMVMDHLGANIHDLWWETTRGARGFDAATAIALSARMLDLLEKLHVKGFIHRDVKPANFVMSGDGGKGNGHLCLIDFGISVPAATEEDAKQQTQSSLWGGAQFYGTRLFASVNAHNGIEQSFRDDLESLIFVLAYMLNGGLPWGDDTNGLDQVKAWKQAAVLAMIAGECGREKEILTCEQDPAVLALVRELLAYCRRLRFGEKPDYAYCRQAIMHAYSAVTGRESIVDDYEWSHPVPQPQAKKPLDFMDLI